MSREAKDCRFDDSTGKAGQAAVVPGCDGGSSVAAALLEQGPLA